MLKRLVLFLSLKDLEIEKPPQFLSLLSLHISLLHELIEKAGDACTHSCTHSTRLDSFIDSPASSLSGTLISTDKISIRLWRRRWWWKVVDRTTFVIYDETPGSPFLSAPATPSLVMNRFSLRCLCLGQTLKHSWQTNPVAEEQHLLHFEIKQAV